MGKCISVLWTERPCEDLGGVAKNGVSLKACRRQRRAATLMATCLRQVLSTQYKFQEVMVSSGSLHAGNALKSEALDGDADKLSLKASNLVSTDSKTPWFSPAAANLGVPTADNFLLAGIEKMNVNHELGKA